MNRYVSITFSTIFFLMVFSPFQVLAASITETKAAIGKDCTASGDFSTAMGWNTTASGFASTATGYSTTASGFESTAMGRSTIAMGERSTAMGYSTTAALSASTAMGHSTIANSLSATAMGYYTQALAFNSTAMGHSTIAAGNSSTAMGHSTIASGKTSTAMGSNTTAGGDYSTAMGGSTKASGNNSIAMGFGTTASGLVSTAMGYYTTAGGDNSWAGGRYMQLTDTADNTFVWGDSVSAQSISTANAFLIFPAGTAGKVGIGTKSPQNLLDLGESHGKKLAVFQKTTGADFYGFGISGNTLEFYAGAAASASPAMVVKKTTGRLGIGTSDPGQKLDIADGSGRVEPGYGWLTSSDQRLKKNISTLEGSLEKISRLRGVRFDSKEAVHVDNGGGKHIGVIAQELEKEYPELVVGDEKTGYKAVAYDKLTAVLIEAVKEMKALNEKQQAEIEELRSMIKELKS